MAMPITLQKYEEHQPWGFRLQGGRDFRTELSVKKVQPNSPAAGYLSPGDRIVGIGPVADASQLTHVQAQELIKAQGCQLYLVLLKGGVQTISGLKPEGKLKFSPYAANQGRQQQQQYNSTGTAYNGTASRY